MNDLRARIEAGHLHFQQATASTRSGRDEARYLKAKAAIEKHGEPARFVLRHLQNVGQFRMGNFYDDPPPRGMLGGQVRDMLTKLQEEELLAVTVIDGRDPSRTFRIAPGMLETVDQLV